MAHVTLSGDTDLLHRIWGGCVAFGQSISAALAVNASADARLREMSRLHAMSDDELAKLGVSRDRIAHYVFRDIFTI